MAEVQALKDEIEKLKLTIQQNQQRTIQIPLPEPIDIKSGDISENFKHFRNQWELYIQATGLVKQDEETQKAILLTAIGNETFKRYGNMPIREEEKQTAALLLNAIEKHLTPSVNKRYVRALFNMAKQEDDETYDEYFNRLRGLIRNAQYGPLQNDLLLDKIICSIKDHNIRERLWLDNEITLDKAIEVCRSKEVSEKQLKGINNNDNIVEVNKIQNSRRNQSFRNSKTTPQCKFCGNEYHDTLENCPAKKVYCRKCNKKGHYARVCMRNDNNNNNKRNSRTVKEVSTIPNSDSDDDQYILNIVKDGHTQGLFKNLMIYNEHNQPISIKSQLDTGATCNIIGYSNLKSIQPNMRIKDTSIKLRTIEGTEIPTIGTTNLTVQNKRIKNRLLFYVIKRDHCPLLSAETCQKLKLIEICKVISQNTTEREAHNIIEKYSDVFEGLGKLAGKITLEIDETVTPKNEPPRRIPITLREELKIALNEMVKNDIIVKEPEYTPWTSNIVLVKRNDKLRICIDPRKLNEALRDVKYQLPTLEEILTEISGAKVFSTIDAKKGFWQLELDKQSSKLTSFWTPFGKYRFKRMPFGIKPAMEIFQMRQNQVIVGLNGVSCIADDILIVGKGDSMEEAVRDHNNNLQHLLERLRKENLKINKEKIKICQRSIKFFGHIFTGEGLRPDPEKIDAIVKMPRPPSKSETLRFLGMATYLGKFIPNMSEVTEPLRTVTHVKSEFVWTNKQEAAFQNIKKIITKTPVLKFFDPKKEVTIQTDASSFAIGCTLMQQGHPVIYASKTLTKTQQKYAQIEKEMIAIVFACKRFDQYICGKNDVLIQTDHQPLINIFKKPLINTPKRLQSMILSLQRYNFTIKYNKGSQMFIADTLSRAPIKENQQEKSWEIYKIEEELERIEHCSDIEHKRISNHTIVKIQKATSEDHIMAILIKTIINGWPENKNETNELIREYWNIRDELIYNNGMVFKGNRILIPQQMKGEILDRLHQPHLGIEATLKLARETVYWRGISESIKLKVQNCDICNKYARNLQKEPLMITEIPRLPFEIVSMDVFEVNIKNKKKYFLITVDHYSDFFEIDELNSLSGKTTVNICRKNFGRHGIPSKVITDNGTNFANTEFVNFAASWEFKHETSSPYHQQANGKAESSVKIAKQLIKKAIESNTDFYKMLLIWRNTPNKIGSSPAKRLFCRWLNCGIPNMNIRQEIIPEVTQKIQQQRLNNKKHFDKRTKEANKLNVGDKVYLKKHPDAVWTKGEVKGKLSDRTCIVSSDQKLYRRNTIHIKQDKSSNQISTDKHDSKASEEQQKDREEKSPVCQQTQKETSSSFKPAPLCQQTQQETGSTGCTSESPSDIDGYNAEPASSRIRDQGNTTASRPKRTIKFPQRFEDYETF